MRITGSPSKPRNIGIDNASSDYIIFLDSDDLFDNGACEFLYNFMISEDVDLVSGYITFQGQDNEYRIEIFKWVNLFDQTKDAFKIRRSRVDKILHSEELSKIKINNVKDNAYCLSDHGFFNKIYKKRLLDEKNIRFPEDIDGGEDAVFLLNYLANSDGIIYVNRPVILYNNTENSLSKSHSIKTIENRLKAYKLMYDISVLNDIEFEFLDILLPEKLTYWFNRHIFIAIHLSNDEIIDLLKKYKILFEKTHKPKTGEVNFFTELFNDIKQDNFNEALIKINKKRGLNTDNDYSIISPLSGDKSSENHLNSFKKR